MKWSDLEAWPLPALPEGLAPLGDAFLRASARREGEKEIPQACRVFMRGLMNALTEADRSGSVCVSFGRIAAALEALRPEGLEASVAPRLVLEGLQALAERGLAEFYSPDGALDCPFVVDLDAAGAHCGRVYLARTAVEERRLARSLARRALEAPCPITEAQHAAIDAMTSAGNADPEQRRAIELAVAHPFAVIAGGPGTGKTSIVVQILECLLVENSDMVVALAAPTGKAASRMRQSIENALFPRAGDRHGEKLAAELPRMRALFEAERAGDASGRIRERTIHKWLLMPHASGERPSAESPLAVDVVVIDEASMMDSRLAARFFSVIAPATRVIVLGDKHQLAAVGPGAVFGEISDAAGPLRGSVATLLTSHRFKAGGLVDRLARAVNHEGRWAEAEERDVFEEVRGVLKSEMPDADGYRVGWHDDPAERPHGLSASALRWLDERLECYVGRLLAYLDAQNEGGDAEAAAWTELRNTFAGFRALAAQRSGRMSVDAVNRYAEAKVAERLLEAGRWHSRRGVVDFPGRAVIVRRNDDALGVFNGDVGIVLPKRLADGTEGLVVRFENAGVEELSLTLMPEHDCAFAMTIHQSQGSEFREVAVFLPSSADSELATRELLYTGITRTKGTVDIFGTADALAASVRTPTSRESGLSARLSESMGASED